jgi:hypothetical protein
MRSMSKNNRFQLLLGIAFLCWACQLMQGQGQTNCQNQTCSYNGDFACFQCTGNAGDGFSCGVQSCATCLTSKCGAKPGGGVKTQGLCEKPFDQLAIDKASMVDASMRDAWEKDQENFMFRLIGNDSDAAILTTAALNHDKALLEQASFVNSSTKKIVAYQIGWILGTSEKDAKITLAPKFEIPDGLPPGATQNVPAIPFPSDAYRPGFRAGFFVANVQFADGSSWSADLKIMKKNALPKASPGKVDPQPSNEHLSL